MALGEVEGGGIVGKARRLLGVIIDRKGLALEVESCQKEREATLTCDNSGPRAWASMGGVHGCSQGSSFGLWCCSTAVNQWLLGRDR